MQLPKKSSPDNIQFMLMIKQIVLKPYPKYKYFIKIRIIHNFEILDMKMISKLISKIADVI